MFVIPTLFSIYINFYFPTEKRLRIPLLRNALRNAIYFLSFNSLSDVKKTQKIDFLNSRTAAEAAIITIFF